MPIYYLDTSALMKLYIPETGSEIIEELFNGLSESETLATSYLTFLEVNSTATRLLKGRAITRGYYRRTLDQLAQDIAYYRVRVIPVQNELIDRAIPIAGEYSLRSLDAVHFASAIASGSLLSGHNLYMVSADREIMTACESYGIPAINPQMDNALDILRALRGRVR